MTDTPQAFTSGAALGMSLVAGFALSHYDTALGWALLAIAVALFGLPHMRRSDVSRIMIALIGAGLAGALIAATVPGGV